MLNKKLNIDDFNIYFISRYRTRNHNIAKYRTIQDIIYITKNIIYKVDIKIINVTYQKEDK